MIESLGEGATLVLTPGWMTKRHIWRFQRELAGAFRLILWDLPEKGSNGQPLTLQHCAAALHQLVKQFSLAKAHYVGWSMGVSLFWQYLRDYGVGPFETLVNIEMIPKMDPRITRVEAVEKSLRIHRERVTRKFIQRIFHQNSPAVDALHESLVQDALSLPLDDCLSVYRDMATADYTKEAKFYAGKHYLVFGRHGFYKGQEALLEQIFPGMPIQYFAHSGHAPFLEESKAFNKFIRDLPNL